MHRGVFRFLEASGFNRAWSAGRRDCITILRYHGVVEDDWAACCCEANASPRGRVESAVGWALPGPLTRSAFRAQIETIQRRYRIISLDEAFEMLAGARPLEPGCVVLSFDDGYRNNATTAFDVLRERSAVAAFFLTTDFVDGVRPLWFDRLEYALGFSQEVHAAVWHLCVHTDEAQQSRNGHGSTAGTGQVHYLEAFKSALKRLDNAAIDGIIAEIEARTGRRLADAWLEDERSAPMTWDQARMLHRAGMNIGAHTVTHQILTAVDAETARRELAQSKKRIEQELGEPCRYFAYPNGSAADFSKETRRWVLETGYSAALTTIEGSAQRGDDLFALRRVAAGKPIEPDKLLAQLSGLLPSALRVRDGLRRAAERWRGRTNRRPADAVGD